MVIHLIASEANGVKKPSEAATAEVSFRNRAPLGSANKVVFWQIDASAMRLFTRIPIAFPTCTSAFTSSHFCEQINRCPQQPNRCPQQSIAVPSNCPQQRLRANQSLSPAIIYRCPQQSFASKSIAVPSNPIAVPSNLSLSPATSPSIAVPSNLYRCPQQSIAVPSNPAQQSCWFLYDRAPGFFYPRRGRAAGFVTNKDAQTTQPFSNFKNLSKKTPPVPLRLGVTS